MDIREVPPGEFNRHPWEISRAQNTIELMKTYLSGLHENGRNLNIANIGAGDMYFDREYLKAFPGDTIWAIDLEYKEFSSGEENLFLVNDIGDVKDVIFDAVVLMNLMEYVDDEVAFLNDLCNRMNPDAIIFFILPAFQFLFSEHDVYVKGLRRYRNNRFMEIIKNTQCLELNVSFYFYSTLFLVRTLEKFFHFATDRHQKNVAKWKYPKNHIITRSTTKLLNLDF